MSDRDRLAADLRHEWSVYEGDLRWPEFIADRLIALGWTRLDGDLTILRAYKKGFQRGRNTLDEERLARAIYAAEDAAGWELNVSEEVLATEIAAAYEVDR